MDEQTVVSEESKEQLNGKRKKREIVIETDGDSVNLARADVAGKIELIAILDGLSGFLKSGGK